MLSEAIADPASEGTITPLFAHDSGELSLELRRAYLQLLRGPYLDAKRHPNLWPVLLIHQAKLRSRLHELFLDLVVDPDELVAFTRQVPADKDANVLVLLRKHNLTFLQSVLMLRLRQELLGSATRGERAVVSAEEMGQFLHAYRRGDDRDDPRWKKRVVNAIEGLKRVHFIEALQGSEDRFEVAPALKIIFSADEILALTKAYANLKDDGDGEPAAEGTASDE